MKIFLLVLGWFITLWSVFGVANLIGMKSYYFYEEFPPWYAVPYCITSFVLILSYTVYIIITIHDEVN